MLQNTGLQKQMTEQFAVEVMQNNILNKISKNAKNAFFKLHFLPLSKNVRLDLKTYLERYLFTDLKNGAKNWST